MPGDISGWYVRGPPTSLLINYGASWQEQFNPASMTSKFRPMITSPVVTAYSTAQCMILSGKYNLCACARVLARICKIPVCVCLWASRASSEENVAPHWSHTSASAGAVDRNQIWGTHKRRRRSLRHEHNMCVCVHLACRGNRLPWRGPAWDTRTRKQMYNSGQTKAADGAQWPFFLTKREARWRVLFTVGCYQSLNSEQTVCLRGHRRTGCSLYSRRFPPAAHPFIKKTLQSQHPKSQRAHCNYSSEFTSGMPLSILMKTRERQVCTPLAETPRTCTGVHTEGRRPRARARVSGTRSCLDVGWLSQRCKSVADPYWPRAHSLIYFLLSWL